MEIEATLVILSVEIFNTGNYIGFQTTGSVGEQSLRQFSGNSKL